MNALSPPPTLLAKLGSIAIHVEEFLSDNGHPFDKEALVPLLLDVEVREWFREMRKLALLPEKRGT